MKVGGGKYSARVFDTGTAEGWKSAVAFNARPHTPAAPIAGPVRVKLAFVFKRPKSHFRSNGVELRPEAPAKHTARPDADNLAKAVLDALTQLGGFWKDDSQVAVLAIYKDYGNQAGAFVEIKEAA